MVPKHSLKELFSYFRGDLGKIRVLNALCQRSLWKSVGVTIGFQGLSLFQTIARDERAKLEQKKASQLKTNP